MERTTLIVYRSNTALEAQAKFDKKTLVGKKFKFTKSSLPVLQAKEFGVEFGKLLLEAKIKQISYDRNGFRYHGKVKAFAEGLREAGIEF